MVLTATTKKKGVHQLRFFSFFATTKETSMVRQSCVWVVGKRVKEEI